ncbi:MAG: DUF4190 domain-containing protein [Verrucomicrobia bacterium]|nr:DUF4190 domain-containing protein [Verrucomicrobiota bacterium]
MDIIFPCTKCGQQLTVDEAGAGQIVPCPKCNQSLIIPSLSVGAPPDSGEATTFPFSSSVVEKPVESSLHSASDARTSAAAVASLILGILSLCLGAITGIPAVILGHVSRSAIQHSKGKLTGAGKALAGLIMGYVSIVVTLTLAVIIIGLAGDNTPRAVASYGSAPDYSSAIDEILKKDQLLGIAMQNKLSGMKIESDEDLNNYARIVNEYATAARGIDLSRCPRDFAEQYWRHISAWSGKSQELFSHPHIPSGGEAFFEGMLRGLNGDWTGGAFERQAEFKTFAQRVQNQESQVRETWREVEALAIRYGVKLSK